jgi:hypothetical protein
MFDFGMTNIEESANRPGGSAVVDEMIVRLERTVGELSDRSGKTSHPAEQAHIEKLRKGVEAARFVLSAFRTSLSDQRN